MGETVTWPQATPDILQDVLQDGLQIVLCGTAVGTASAVAGAYYAHKQNKFWKILHETGLTPELLGPHQYRELLRYRIGLTDFVKTHSGMDHQIPLSELTEISRARLGATIATFRPQFLAFTSKNAGQRFLGGRRDYGEQLRADRRYPNLDPALDLRRRQWQLAPGSLARVCREGEGSYGLRGAPLIFAVPDGVDDAGDKAAEGRVHPQLFEASHFRMFEWGEDMVRPPSRPAMNCPRSLRSGRDSQWRSVQTPNC